MLKTYLSIFLTILVVDANICFAQKTELLGQENMEFESDEQTTRSYEKLIRILDNETPAIETRKLEAILNLLEKISDTIESHNLNYERRINFAESVDRFQKMVSRIVQGNPDDPSSSKFANQCVAILAKIRSKIWKALIRKSHTPEEYVGTLLNAFYYERVDPRGSNRHVTDKRSIFELPQWTIEERQSVFSIGDVSVYEAKFNRDPLLMFVDAVQEFAKLHGEALPNQEQQRALGRLIAKFAPLVLRNYSMQPSTTLKQSGENATTGLAKLAKLIGSGDEFVGVSISRKDIDPYNESRNYVEAVKRSLRSLVAYLQRKAWMQTTMPALSQVTSVCIFPGDTPALLQGF